MSDDPSLITPVFNEIHWFFDIGPLTRFLNREERQERKAGR
jgi:hypothetical protein